VAAYINPLPHVLMLTAIVVMVATLGVALAIVIKIYRRYHTLQEDEIFEAMK
jgi:multicomponent Na+:H+ antiporter subunit C